MIVQAVADLSKVALPVVLALNLLGGIGLGIKALLERRAVKAQAHHDEASGAQMISAAARELVDPLRESLRRAREDFEAELAKCIADRDAALAQTKALHDMEMRTQTREVEVLLGQTHEANNEVHALRAEVQALRQEIAALRAENAQLRAEHDGQ